MQEFLTNNIVNCNLMSLTGYRTLVILSVLMESPKTNDELNDYLFNNQYIRERFSSDTLRIYINSLRSIGCEINSANKSNEKKYVLVSHPFDYNIPKSQIKALFKLYKNIYDKIEIKELMIIESFFKKLSFLVKDENTKDLLNNISMLKGIDNDILNDLLLHCKNKNQITILYNSPHSGKKEIEVIADKLSFKANKLSDRFPGRLYFFGNNLTHKQYSYFAMDRILKICSIKISKSEEDFPPIRVIYELYNHNDVYVPNPNEKIIEKTGTKLVIEAISKNEFNLMQRFLYMAGDCKIIEPKAFKAKLLEKLETMEESYENI